MRYIKKFENWGDDIDCAYKEGDYVKLVELDPDDDDQLGFIYPYAKILEVYSDCSPIECYIETFNSKGRIVNICIRVVDYIEGFMNDDEIKNYNIKKEQEKFNL